MKKYVYWVFTFLLFSAQQLCFAAEKVSPELENSLKQTSTEPNFLTIISALIFVIAMIYITGLIYSKLNIVGAKAVREQINNQDLSRVVILSTTQLGQGKNLHVIELNKKKYLIGAAQNITLLKELENEPVATQEIQEKVTSKKIIADSEFDIHKKYL